MDDKKLKVKRAYTTPRIYSGKKQYNPKDRWYIYYSYLNPGTQKMERQKLIYLDINRRYKKKRERLKHFTYVRDVLDSLLEDGYSPYTYAKVDEENLTTAKSCIMNALEIKKADVTDKTFRDYKAKVKVFVKYLIENNLDYYPIGSITRQHVKKFLDNKESETSTATRNCYLKVLSSIFSQLMRDKHISENVIKTLKLYEVEVLGNKVYSPEEEDRVLGYLKDNEPSLHLLVKFVSFVLLRPIEVCRLRVKDINFEKRVLSVKTKTKQYKSKTIPQLMLDELLHYDLSNPEAYLITKDGIAVTDESAEKRRAFFTKKYQQIRKSLDIEKGFTLYSFRHTSITKMYKKLRLTSNLKETLNRLMEITGHTTRDGLVNYLREADIEVVDDYSDLFVA